MDAFSTFKFLSLIKIPRFTHDFPPILPYVPVAVNPTKDKMCLCNGLKYLSF